MDIGSVELRLERPGLMAALFSELQKNGHFTVKNTSDVGLFLDVLLDGGEVRNAIEAHTKEGWVVVVTDGGCILADQPSDPGTKKLYGKVEVGRQYCWPNANGTPPQRER